MLHSDPRADQDAAEAASINPCGSLLKEALESKGDGDLWRRVIVGGGGGGGGGQC